MLNRIVRWTPVGLEYEDDPRQAEQLIRDMGMSGSKPVGTPGVKVTSEQLAEDRDLSHQRQRTVQRSSGEGKLPLRRPP